MKFSYNKRIGAVLVSTAMLLACIRVYAEEPDDIMTMAEMPIEVLAEEPEAEEAETVAEPAEEVAEEPVQEPVEDVPAEQPETAAPIETESVPEEQTEVQTEKQTEQKSEEETEEISDKSEQEDEELEIVGSGDPNADTESQAMWESTLPELTGIWRDDIVKIAQSQLGYTESTRNYTSTETGTKGYTRYGAWYGMPYGDWCAMFASFCIYYAGVPSDMMPINSYTVTWIDELNAMNLYQSKGTGYVPQPGDLIFFARDGVNVTHVGIVEEAVLDENGNYIQVNTIEGNSSNMVKRNSYSPYDGYVIGYGMIPDQPEDMMPNMARAIQISDPSSEEDVASALALIREQRDLDLAEIKDEEEEVIEVIEEDTEEPDIPTMEDMQNSLSDIRNRMAD